MAIVTEEVRRRRTKSVAKVDGEGKIMTPNGHKGRSQKGCFGGKK